MSEINSQSALSKSSVNLHNVIINTRSEMTVNGIIDVKSFDENLIVAKTEEEALSIRGENLHIDKLDLDSGRLEISGRIDQLTYSKAYITNETIWEKLFK